eukprot:10578948-Ditylum_brightwellii.AAC.1
MSTAIPTPPLDESTEVSSSTSSVQTSADEYKRHMNRERKRYIHTKNQKEKLTVEQRKQRKR